MLGFLIFDVFFEIFWSARRKILDQFSRFRFPLLFPLYFFLTEKYVVFAKVTILRIREGVGMYPVCFLEVHNVNKLSHAGFFHISFFAIFYLAEP